MCQVELMLQVSYKINVKCYLFAHLYSKLSGPTCGNTAKHGCYYLGAR